MVYAPLYLEARKFVESEFRWICPDWSSDLHMLVLGLTRLTNPNRSNNFANK